MKNATLINRLWMYPPDADVTVNSGAECGIDNALEIESVQGIDRNGDVPASPLAVVKISIRAPGEE